MLESLSCGLDRDAEVESEDTWRFLNDLLLANGLSLTGLRTDGPYLLGIRSTHSRSDHVSGSRAVPVEFSELANLSDFGALIVETQVSFEAANARNVANALRGLIVDPHTSMLLAVGDTNSVVVSGPVHRVSRIADTMRRADVSLAQMLRAETPAAPSQEE